MQLKASLNRDKDTLTIEIPYNNSDDAPKSTSGKSRVRASTRGNTQVNLGDRTVMMGINVYEKTE